ncbi:MAG TPA: hypothetical protein VGN72_05980 [Tepidisphaeraceae bacterium]|jgi:vacuolar-type H+-ATPase subunit I/STV1|nr:hypothetical protein [Tepidisphaeraceae bacterium]
MAWIKYTALFVAVTLGSAVFVVAEETAQPTAEKPAQVEKERKVRLPKPYSQLETLSDDQKQQIAEVRKNIAAEMKALREKEQTEIAAILTDDQKAQIAAMEEADAAARKAKQAEKANAPTTVPAAE